MNGWRRYLELQAQSRTGLSAGLVVAAAIGLMAALATLILAIVAIYIGLADRYSPLTAALVLTIAFLLITIVALACCILVQRRNVQRAQLALALAARSSAPWLDARTMAMGMQVGRAIGWRKLVPLVAVGFLAAELAKGFLNREKTDANQAGEEA
jgi:hypothetical protein